MKWHILLCRHGHRAPTASLVPHDVSHTFNAAWQELALARTEPVLDSLNKYYPVINSPSNPSPHDIPHYPFGSLTYTGAEHMYNVGKSLGDEFPELRQIPLDEIHVTATNYQRTQRSAQFLLNGLHEPSDASFHNRDFKHYEETGNNLPIFVSEQTHCPLTFYERNLDLTVKLVNKVLHKEQYQTIENSPLLTETKKAMANAFPILAKGRYGFNWPVSFDYFACSRGHKFEILPELQEYESIVSNHYIYRYWCYNRDPAHLAHFIQPFLQTLVQNIVHIHEQIHHQVPKDYHAIQSKHAPKHAVKTILGKPTTVSGKLPKMVFYSAHDINIFALLMALGVESITRGPQSQPDLMANLNSLWPYYGSTVLFEVDSSDAQMPVLKIYWNRKPVGVDMQYMLSHTEGLTDAKLFDASSPSHLKKEMSFTFQELLQLNNHLQHFLVQNE